MTDLTPVEPARKVKPKNSKPKAGEKQLRFSKLFFVVAVVIACALASFFGAWALINFGLVKVDATKAIADNSQKIVMQQGEVISEVYKKVNPSVVAITTQSTTPSASNYRMGSSQSQVSEGAGSGIIISKDGYIITNKHVVPQGSSKISVTTSDGKEYTDVKFIGSDPNNDIAFIKINGIDNLTPAQIGDSNGIIPGQQVIAIGNALGIFRNSVTSGIISGIGRPITAADELGDSAEQLEDMFQTDAAINLGNSGGPLVNLSGEVIGINTAISADGQALAFAIPINAAKAEINSVISQGKIVKAYLGVRFVGITPENAAKINAGTTEGAYVGGDTNSPAVVNGSPAQKAGLKAGDVITKVNETKITSGRGLSTLIAQYSPGDKVELTILRDKQEQKITVVLADYPK